MIGLSSSEVDGSAWSGVDPIKAAFVTYSLPSPEESACLNPLTPGNMIVEEP